MEDAGIDEAFLDISGRTEPPDETAGKIKDLIFRKTGLTCSIGIAPNKLLAKIASDLRKPDGLTIIEKNNKAAVINPLPVRKLWGVGPKTEAHLKEMGINTVGELADAPLEKLMEVFGRSYGGYLYNASRGIDESPLVTHWEPKSVSREMTFEKDINDWQELAKTLAGLVREVASEMKGEGYKGKTVTVKIRFADFKTITRAKSLDEPSGSPEVLRKAAFEAMGRGIKQTRKGKVYPLVRLIGFRVSNLAS
jgi:DNA polymerase-4